MNFHEDRDKTMAYEAIPVGTKFSHYVVAERIGTGGMGEVYLAEDNSLGRPVALKFLSPVLSSNEDARRRFVREAQAAAQLDHPNIITVYEVGEFLQRPYFAMQRIEGQTLREYSLGKKLPVREIMQIGAQICDGLHAAHQKGIVHRDIKPGNIMIDSAGRVRIVDFGLAAVQHIGAITQAGSTLGTIAYMSPEQARGEKVDIQTDIWSFGVMMFELLAGELPFSGEYEQAVIYAILNQAPKSLAELRPDIPLEVHRIIVRTLAKSANERYPDAGRLAADLRRAIESLSDSSPARPSASSVLPSIAVLPFRDMSPQADQDYFCEGIAEELINVLARIEGLHVSARTSAFQFKGKEIDVRNIGVQLGVRTILEGSVRKAGNRVRITTQLVNVADGYHLWSERFDRELDDIFAIQDEISLAVVEKLKTTLLDEDRERIAKRYTQNKEAYQLYLRGRYFWNRRYEGELRRAVECFSQAIKLDPQYALAYSGVADCYVILAQYGWLRPLDAFAIARSAAQKALEIDPDLSEAHVSMAWIKAFHDWDLAAAEAEFKRAIELNPNNVTAHHWYAICLGPMKRFDDGWREFGIARELDPFSISLQAIAGLAHYNCRQFDEAVDQLVKTLEIDPTFYLALLFLGWSYAAKAMWDESIATLTKLTTSPKVSPISLASLGASLAMSGRTDEARDILARLHEMESTTYVSPYYEAMIFAGLGDRDQAFDCLDKALLEREPFMITLATLPLLDSLRDDPRMDRLLTCIGLA